MNQHAAITSKNISIILIITFFVAVLLVIDGLITKLPVYSYQNRGSDFLVYIFSLLLVSCIAIQMMYLKLTVIRKSFDFGFFKVNSDIMKFVMIGIQASIIAMGLTIAIQIGTSRSYNSDLVQVSIIVSSLSSVSILFLLFTRFVSWFTTSRNKLLLLYSIAVLSMFVNSLVVLMYSYFSFLNSYDLITPSLASINDTPFTYSSIKNIYLITSILQFCLTWVASVLLLRSYSFRIGRVKFWILMLLPLVYFVSKFQFLFINVFTTYNIMSPVEFFRFYTAFFAVTDLVGGFIFGFVFWIISRNVSDVTVKYYMNISGIGILLIFISSTVTGITLLPYPPFGLATNSFMGLASYLLLVGIYQSAIRTSSNSMIRTLVKKSVLNEVRFLGSIGTSQMEREIEDKVIKITKEQSDKMREETGVDSSFDEDNLKQYLKEILEEIKDKKKLNTKE